MKLPAYIQHLLMRLETQGFQAFVVGGCVRDSLLGLTPDDWDICTSAKPDELLAVFQDFAVIPTGIQHGTVTVVCDEGHAEITTFRNDGIYVDRRHPKSVTFVPDIHEDLARRDFTVNAMAYSPKHGLIDPHGGRMDLQKKILRCVGEADKRLKEDALRILRALRFAVVYDLSIEHETSLAMLRNRDGITSVARERIFTELKKTFYGKCPGKTLLHYPEILSVIFETTIFCELSDEERYNLIDYLDKLPPSPSMRLAGLFYPLRDDFKLCTKLVQSLKPDNKTKHQALTCLSLWEKPFPATLEDTRYLTGQLSMELLTFFLTWKTGQVVFLPQEKQKDFNHDALKAKQFLMKIQEDSLCCSIKELAINGNDLRTCGILDGKEIGNILQQVLQKVIREELPNEKKAILTYLFCK